jgi:hypothetical protein
VELHHHLGARRGDLVDLADPDAEDPTLSPCRASIARGNSAVTVLVLSPEREHGRDRSTQEETDAAIVALPRAAGCSR